jgi:hypothetical protein
MKAHFKNKKIWYDNTAPIYYSSAIKVTDKNGLLEQWPTEAELKIYPGIFYDISNFLF